MTVLQSSSAPTVPKCSKHQCNFVRLLFNLTVHTPRESEGHHQHGGIRTSSSFYFSYFIRVNEVGKLGIVIRCNVDSFSVDLVHTVQAEKFSKRLS